MTTRAASIMAEDSEASSVLDLLQEAKDNNHHSIYLNYKGLHHIPKELVDDDKTFRYLQHLYLKRNLIKTLVLINFLLLAFSRKQICRKLKSEMDYWLVIHFHVIMQTTSY